MQQKNCCKRKQQQFCCCNTMQCNAKKSKAKQSKAKQNKLNIYVFAIKMRNEQATKKWAKIQYEKEKQQKQASTCCWFTNTFYQFQLIYLLPSLIKRVRCGWAQIEISLTTHNIQRLAFFGSPVSLTNKTFATVYMGGWFQIPKLHRFLFFGQVGLSMEQAFVNVSKWSTTKEVCFWEHTKKQ